MEVFSMYYDLEITHHGVKGMKWGVRRSEAQLQRAASKEGRSRFTDGVSSAARKTASAVKSGTRKVADAVRTMDPETRAAVGGAATAVGAYVGKKILDRKFSSIMSNADAGEVRSILEDSGYDSASIDKIFSTTLKDIDN